MPHTSVCGQSLRAERRGLQATKGVVLGEEIALLRVLIRRFAEQIKLKRPPAASAQCRTRRCAANHGETPIETAANLAVISEAMLRLGSLLRTDHMLGGTASSTFVKQLNRVLADISDEMTLDET